MTSMGACLGREQLRQHAVLVSDGGRQISADGRISSGRLCRRLCSGLGGCGKLRLQLFELLGGRKVLVREQGQQL